MARGALVGIEPRTEAGRVGQGLQQGILSGRGTGNEVGATIASGFQLGGPKPTFIEHLKLVRAKAGNRIAGAVRTAAYPGVGLRKAGRYEHRHHNCRYLGGSIKL